MSARLRMNRVGPATTIQDAGRFGMLRHGISESGPMDRGGFRRAGALLGRAGGEAIEFSAAGSEIEFQISPAQNSARLFDQINTERFHFGFRSRFFRR